MAKKDNKKASKKDKGHDPADVVDAVRGAVERTFQATAGGTEGARDRGKSLLDDVASAAQRIRESFDDLRVLEDVRGLRAEIEALSRRVAELEKKQAKPAARSSRSATARTTAARSAASKAGNDSARSAAPKARTGSARSTAARTAASRSGGAATRSARARAAPAKPSAARTTPAKPAPSRPKPASPGSSGAAS